MCLVGHNLCVQRRDETSEAVVDAARGLFARWAPRGKEASLVIVVNPINRLIWRRWRVVEGLDVRVGCHRNPPPEGLTLGGHRSLQFLVRERQPFSSDWTVIDDLNSIVAEIERQLTQWAS
jgi:hypothetical protein